jgi:hypothetical protein
MEEARTKDKTDIWCDERLNTKSEEVTRLGHTGLIGVLEHLKIKTRFIDEKFVSVFRTAVSVCYILNVGQWKFRCSMSSGHCEGGP